MFKICLGVLFYLGKPLFLKAYPVEMHLSYVEFLPT